jgi:hypothetical protein
MPHHIAPDSQDAAQRLVSALSDDDRLRSLWSESPRCSIFPYHGSGDDKTVVVTVFLREGNADRGRVAEVCFGVVSLLRPLLELIPHWQLLQLWVAGHVDGTFRRILRLCVLKQSVNDLLLDDLSPYFGTDYYEQSGIFVYMYYPLK